MNGLMVTGLSLFFGGGLVFLYLLFASGGARKSVQLRVLGELWRGDHGIGRRRGVRIAAIAAVIGALFLFAGVSAVDAERAEHCHEWCADRGYPQGGLAPSTEQIKGKAAYRACRCSGGDKPPVETRADSL